MSYLRGDFDSFQIYTTYRVLFTDSHHIVEKFHKMLVVEIFTFESCENSEKLPRSHARCNRFHENLTSDSQSLDQFQIALLTIFCETH